METLTLVCRAAQARRIEKPAKTVTRYGYTFPSLGTAGGPIHGGDWSQCGTTATFTAPTLTGAANDARADGWAVDRPHIGESSRLDLCPDCASNVGRRGWWLGLEDLGVDRLTTRQLPLAFAARG